MHKAKGDTIDGEDWSRSANVSLQIRFSEPSSQREVLCGNIALANLRFRPLEVDKAETLLSSLGFTIAIRANGSRQSGCISR